MKWQRNREMSPQQFENTIAALQLNQLEAGRYLGVSPRTARRYVSGHAEVPASAALLLRSLLYHGEQPVLPPIE